MESRRFLLAIALMIATVLAVNLIFPPARRAPTTSPDSAAAPVPEARPDTTPAVPRPEPAAPQPVAPAAVADNGAIETIVVESGLYRFGISTRGAAIVSAELLNYESFTRTAEPGATNRPPVQLAPVAPHGLVNHQLRIEGRQLDFRTVTFVPDSRHIIIPEGSEARTIVFRGTDPGSGMPLEISYTFRPDNYLADVVARALTAGRSAQLMLGIGPTLAENEANPVEDRRALAYVVNSRREGIHSVLLEAVAKRGSGIEEGPLDWVAIKNKYFLLAALPVSLTGQAAFGGLLVGDAPGRYSANLLATLPFNSDQTASYRLYLGPQEYDRQVALGLEDVNPIGWRWIRPIVQPLGHAFTWVLLSTHRVTGLGYGWVLILFGIAVRLSLWPLNAKAMRSSMKNMELQPRMKEIQTKYKSNPEQLQKEMVKLYREEGFNPLGGCLPLMLPMPVLITLFFVLQRTIEFRGVSFLWLPDLSVADPLYILPILLGVTMFIQQWLSMRTSPPNPQAQMLLWFMPAFMVLLFLNFASGLNLYYAAQNFASFPQQLQLIRERQRYQASRGVQVAAAAVTKR